MLDPVPWFTGNTAQHSPAVARMLAHAATQGSNGVIGFSDLKVTATSVPGTNVVVAPGGAIFNNIYPGGQQQSYMGRGVTSTDFPIPATGSASGATRYVILRIDDPEFGGQTPVNPVVGPYIRIDQVASITGLLYPHIVLAKIVQPASTGTITNAMITDMRKVANPRTKRELELGPSPAANLTNAAFVQWPNYTPTVEVPAWATHVVGVARVHSAILMTGTTYGQYRLKVGDVLSGTAGFDFNDTGSRWDGMRLPTLSVGINAAVPVAMRGKPALLKMEAFRAGGAGYLQVDSLVQVEYDIQFEERPA